MCQIPELQPEQAAGLVASYSMLIYGDAKTDKPTLCTRAQCLLDRYSSAVWMNVVCIPDICSVLLSPISCGSWRYFTICRKLGD